MISLLLCKKYDSKLKLKQLIFILSNDFWIILTYFDKLKKFVSFSKQINNSNIQSQHVIKFADFWQLRAVLQEEVVDVLVPVPAVIPLVITPGDEPSVPVDKVSRLQSRNYALYIVNRDPKKT